VAAARRAIVRNCGREDLSRDEDAELEQKHMRETECWGRSDQKSLVEVSMVNRPQVIPAVSDEVHHHPSIPAD